MKYTTKHEEKRRYILAIVVIALIFLAGMISQACEAEKPQWDVCYPMANQHIEWTYAGGSK